MTQRLRPRRGTIGRSLYGAISIASQALGVVCVQFQEYSDPT